MNIRLWSAIFGLATLVTLGSTSPAHAEKAPPTFPGVLNVQDDANLFTPKGVQEARDKFEQKRFPKPTHLTIVTVAKIPAAKQTEFTKVMKDGPARARFFQDWTRALAKEQQETGVFVLMFDDGSRYITETVSDRETATKRGFGEQSDRELSSILNEGSQSALKKLPAEAQPLRDAALLKAVEFTAKRLERVNVSTEATSSDPLAAVDGGAASASPLMGYLCIGLMALLGIWLVMGLIRAFSGGGGFGGGGFGGGGFLTSMLGGLFGAAAGMYLYDQFFGSGATDAAAASGMDGGDTGADAGAGDWDGGSAGGDGGGDWGGGGDFGGGDFGGGDW